MLPAQVTPLHTDPYHNLLTQVIGRKHVRLYSPQVTPRLYPFESGFTTNCSQVSSFFLSQNLVQISDHLQNGCKHKQALDKLERCCNAGGH